MFLINVMQFCIRYKIYLGLSRPHLYINQKPFILKIN